MHLKHIVSMFSNGDFSIPMFVHSQTPPGVTEMKDKRADIIYTFEELPTGGRVRITTANHDTLNAVHDFPDIPDRRPSNGRYHAALIT